MIILYFSATGNSLYVAKELGEQYYSIPQMIKEGTYEFEDEQIGVIFPSFYNGVPKLVDDFIRKAKLNSPYIFGIITYGMIAGATARHLIKIGGEVNIKFSYVNEIVMVDNFLPMFEMSKQIEDEESKQIDAQIKGIKEDIINKKEYQSKHNIAFGLFRLINKYRHRKDSDADFTVDNTCNGCGICTQVCPVDNIDVEDRPVFKNNCQQCLSCIHNCPQTAIHIKKEKSSARFSNSKISLQEIIEANK